MATIEETDAASAAVASAPEKRISLSYIESRIMQRFDIRGHESLRAGETLAMYTHEALEKLSICILVMDNGFVVIGKSAPHSAENFNRELGRKFAYEDAIRQLWPLMAFSRLDNANG